MFVNIATSLRLIFADGNQNGNLTRDAYNVCKLLAINPDDISHKTLQHFAAPNISQ